MANLHAAAGVLRARDLADARYFERLTVADLARASHLSPGHFSRAFRDAFGETPHQYLLTRRLERAAALLRTTDRSISEICFAVGLSSVGSFTTSYRRIYGMSPMAYRQSLPSPEGYVRIPVCVAQAYGRRRNRSFREDDAPTAP